MATSNLYNISFTVCFKIFDSDRDNYLNPNEIEQMKKTLLFIASENKLTYSSNILHENMQKPDPFIENLSEPGTNDIDSTQKHKKSLECLAEKLDENGGLTLEDFLVWSVQNNCLIAPLLELLFQVCHVSLGLRPHCRHEEYEIGKLFNNPMNISTH